MMTSNQPYLVKAIYQWILDNEKTPHILVSTDVPSVEVPTQSVKDDQIVLNIAPHAVSNLVMDNEAVSFSARFSGVAQSLYIPVKAIRAIYASENGQGMVFPELEEATLPSNSDETDNTDDSNPDSPPDKTPPFLKVIK